MLKLYSTDFFIFDLLSFMFNLNVSVLLIFQVHLTHLKRFILQFCLLVRDQSLTFISFFNQSFKCVTFLASKLEHFQNDIHFRRDIQYTLTLRIQDIPIFDFHNFKQYHRKDFYTK